MYIPTAQPSEQAPHRSESQFSASYWAPFLTLFTVNGLSVALLMRSLVLCNQVLSELRRVHFTGSQGTRSNQNAVFPPVCNNTTITFHHRCAVIQSWRKAGTREQTNKHTDREWNQRGITEPEADSFLPFLSVYLSQLHWNRMLFRNAVIQEMCSFTCMLSSLCCVFFQITSHLSLTYSIFTTLQSSR